MCFLSSVTAHRRREALPWGLPVILLCHLCHGASLESIWPRPWRRWSTSGKLTVNISLHSSDTHCLLIYSVACRRPSPFGSCWLWHLLCVRSTKYELEGVNILWHSLKMNMAGSVWGPIIISRCPPWSISHLWWTASTRIQVLSSQSTSHQLSGAHFISCRWNVTFQRFGCCLFIS